MYMWDVFGGRVAHWAAKCISAFVVDDGDDDTELGIVDVALRSGLDRNQAREGLKYARAAGIVENDGGTWYISKAAINAIKSAKEQGAVPVPMSQCIIFVKRFGMGGSRYKIIDIRHIGRWKR